LCRMATYINYGEGEEDATVQGAEWLKEMIAVNHGADEAQNFHDKFKDLHLDQSGRGQYDCAPVFDLFIQYSEDLFSQIPEASTEKLVKEVESYFSLVLSMLQFLEEPGHLDRSTTRLCHLFSASADQQPELRLRLLMMLYNTYNNPTIECRYKIFKYVLDFAASAKLFDQVLPYLEFLDSWMVDWDPYLTVDDKRTLFRDISEYLRSLGKRLDAFLYLKRYHLHFQGADSSVLSSEEVQSQTLQLVKDALQLPTVIQFDDILGLDTVKALSKSQHKDLLGLCEVFLSGGVNDLKDFHSAHQTLFEEHDISFQEAMSKIRLLALATLVHGKSEMSLSEVANALEESVDNVERWVVKALSEGVIDGRIDQLNRKVLVKSSFQRKFEKEEWAFLDSKLSNWIDNLENVIKFIGEQKKGVAVP